MSQSGLTSRWASALAGSACVATTKAGPSIRSGGATLSESRCAGFPAEPPHTAPARSPSHRPASSGTARTGCGILPWRVSPPARRMRVQVSSFSPISPPVWRRFAKCSLVRAKPLHQIITHRQVPVSLHSSLLGRTYSLRYVP